MGVPSFYRWLVNKYPKIVLDASQEMDFDNLYLDMNGIIHPCFHPESDDIVPPTTFEDVFKNIYEYIDKLFDIVKPRKLVYMAIDGVAPRAKMNQQRSRRFRTAKDNETAEEMEEELRKQFEKEGKKVLPKEQSELSDSNIITPGTQFMSALSEKLQRYIKLRMTTDSRWKSIKVILSDSNVPGEGEHKIMSFIRAQRCCVDYDPNTRHCLYGLDADLIMLALATHEVHFSILREVVLVQEERLNSVSELERTAQQREAHKHNSRAWFKQKTVSGLTSESYHPEAASISDDQKVNGRSPVMKIPFQFLNVWVLREYLQIDMRIGDLPEKSEVRVDLERNIDDMSIGDLPKRSEVKVDLERIIDDFIFMCFFVGNDFLPHMPTLALHEGAIDLLMHVYKNEFKNLGGYLIDTQRIEDKKAGYIKLKRVEKFLAAVGQYEDKIFKKRAEIRDHKIRRIIDAENADSQEHDAKFERDIWYTDSTSSSGKATGNTYPSQISDANQTSLSGVVQATDDDAEVLINTIELKQRLKEQIRHNADTFRHGDLGTDKVKLGTPGYKERYYDEKFSTKNHKERETKRKEVVQKYTEGLCWVLKYYYAGVPSWNWFYPFHYGPFTSDFKGLSQVKIMFRKGLPFKPFDQLMAVLPPKSADALPGAYQKLMLVENSKIIDFYPTDFKIDLDGKRFLWQAVCKLPFIEEERLLTETKIIEKELKDNEKERNGETADRLFVSSLSSLGEKIISISRNSPSSTNSNAININPILGNGISGFMRLEFNGLTAIDFNDRSDNPDALCVFYELPRCCLHKPHLLDGVKVPEKMISEEDIVESVLWHESSGNTSNRRPLNQIQKTKFSSRNEEHDIMHRDAGIGWVGGRDRVYSPSASAGQIAIGHGQVSDPSQGSKSFHQSENRNLWQSSSTSPSTRSHLDWRPDRQSRATPSEQHFRGGWKSVNASHSWMSGQSFYSTPSARQPSEQHFRGWENVNAIHSWMSGQSFSSTSSVRQPSERHFRGWQNGIINDSWTNGQSFSSTSSVRQPSEQHFGGWKYGNINHSWTNGQSVSSTSSARQPSEQHFGGWKNVNINDPQTNDKSFSSSSARQQTYGRGKHVPKATNTNWKTKDTYEGSFQ